MAGVQQALETTMSYWEETEGGSEEAGGTKGQFHGRRTETRVAQKGYEAITREQGIAGLSLWNKAAQSVAYRRQALPFLGNDPVRGWAKHRRRVPRQSGPAVASHASFGILLDRTSCTTGKRRACEGMPCALGCPVRLVKVRYAGGPARTLQGVA